VTGEEAIGYAAAMNAHSVAGRLALLIAVALSVLAVPPALAGGAQAARWTADTSPTRSKLLDVSCATPAECVAVGAGATIVRTVNGGKTWRSVASAYGNAHPSTSFTSVRCPTPAVCSVLAAPNVVLHTVNGGRTWRARAITLSSDFSGLGHLACPTRAVCFVTASPAGNPETWFTHSAAIFKTSDGNRSWRRLSIPPSVPCEGDCQTVGFDLQWISCQNAQSCRSGGDAFIDSHSGYAAVVLRTDNGGSTWSLVPRGPLPTTATCPTVSVCTGIFNSPDSPNVGPYLVRTTDGGRTWRSASVSSVFTAIACSGSTFCGLVGPRGAIAVAAGMRVTLQGSPTTRNLNAVACPRASVCYAVGGAGTILSHRV
jgi:photosystem II stability/assembly factor-like uncharacterized protein